MPHKILTAKVLGTHLRVGWRNERLVRFPTLILRSSTTLPFGLTASSHPERNIRGKWPLCDCGLLPCCSPAPGLDPAVNDHLILDSWCGEVLSSLPPSRESRSPTAGHLQSIGPDGGGWIDRYIDKAHIQQTDWYQLLKLAATLLDHCTLWR